MAHKKTAQGKEEIVFGGLGRDQDRHPDISVSPGWESDPDRRHSKKKR
jgi:hypothetical protein